VVIHEAFGLNADIREKADRLAARGYPGSGHRFMSEASGAGAVLAGLTRMSYQEADAADAWQRIYAFFGEHLDDNLAG
jgi:carboxymethylenebutenolidase